MSIPFAEQTFVIIEVLQRKRCLLVEAWFLPPRNDDPRTHQPPIRMLYRTVELSNIKKASEWVQFGYLLIRTGELTITIQAVDGKGKPKSTPISIPLACEPEALGLIKTEK